MISVVIKAIHKGLFLCVIANNLDLVAATTEMEHEKMLGNISLGRVTLSHCNDRPQVTISWLCQLRGRVKLSVL